MTTLVKKRKTKVEVPIINAKIFQEIKEVIQLHIAILEDSERILEREVIDDVFSLRKMKETLITLNKKIEKANTQVE